MRSPALLLFGALFIPAGRSAPASRLNVRQLSAAISPSTTLLASYERGSVFSSSNVNRDRVDASFTTSIPSINVDNLPISSVTCSKTSVSVELQPDNSASTLISGWNISSDGLLLLIDGQWNCSANADGTAVWLKADGASASTDQTTILFANTAPADISTHVSDYSFVISGLTNGTAAAAVTDPTAFRATAESAKLNIQFGPTDEHAEPKTIVDGFAVACRGCVAKASFGLKVELKGRVGKLPEIKLATEGLVSAGVGLHIVTSKNLNTQTLAKISLLDVPINPFDIPGIISIGPQFSITLKISLSQSLKASFDTGFDLSMGSSFTAEVQGSGDQNGDGTATNYDPTIKMRPIKIQEIDGSLTGKIAIGPELSLGIKVLQKDLISVGVRLINEVAATITGVVDLQATDACPLKFEMKTDSRLQAFAGSIYSKDLATLFAKDVIPSTCIALTA